MRRLYRGVTHLRIFAIGTKSRECESDVRGNETRRGKFVFAKERYACVTRDKNSRHCLRDRRNYEIIRIRRNFEIVFNGTR